MIESHTIENAMKREELTEEEAYFILRFAGHVGYDKAIRRIMGRPIYDLRRWFIWFGGWESAELNQWDSGWPAWHFKNVYGGQWSTPYPLSILGHMITFYSDWFQVRLTKRWIFVFAPRTSGAYISKDGTPQHPETKFLWNKHGRK